MKSELTTTYSLQMSSSEHSKKYKVDDDLCFQ